MTKYDLVREDYDNVDTGFHNSYDSTQEFSSAINSFCSRLSADANILNVGGTTSECNYFLQQHLNVTNIDISQAMLDQISNNVNQVKLVNGNIKDYVSPVFDGVWACRSLIHIPPPDINEVLKNICRLTKPGGVFGAVFFVSSTNQIVEEEQPERHTTKAGIKFYRALYPPTVIKSKIEQAGFSILRVDSYLDRDKEGVIYIEAVPRPL
ncbi:MAG: hypothetical protein QG553_233 [Patescibacteria group bacterium]|nr:hypothetical protein [Patescibacteria group bacterium]